MQLRDALRASGARETPYQPVAEWRQAEASTGSSDGVVMRVAVAGFATYSPLVVWALFRPDANGELRQWSAEQSGLPIALLEALAPPDAWQPIMAPDAPGVAC